MRVATDVDATRALAGLAAAQANATRAMVVLVESEGEHLRERWRDNAVETAGKHGIHYPNSIESNLVVNGLTVVATIGPNPDKPQGGMSFEEGSVNQPPHNDGLHALAETPLSISRRLAGLRL